MKFKRRIKITSETERKFSFAVQRTATTSSSPVRFFCSACDAESEMLSINEAARISSSVWREIVSSIETGELHSTETDAGEIYVCARSLAFEEKNFKQKGAE